MRSFKTYLAESAGIPYSEYGYWITADGKIEALPDPDDYMDDSGGGGHNYDMEISDHFRHGDIRIVGHDGADELSVEIPSVSVTKKGISSLRQLIQKMIIHGTYELETYDNDYRHISTREKRKALEWLNQIKPKH